MDTAGFDLLLWIAGGVLAFKLLELFFVSPEERRWRRLSQMLITPLGEVREGVQVKVRGKIRYAEPPLAAPISGRPCAYYEVAVRHMVGGSWDLLAHERRSNDSLWLDDDSGTALVDLTWVRVLRGGVSEELLAGGRLHDRDEHVQAYFASRALQPREVAAYSELVLPEEEVVSVIGTAQREPDPAPRRAVGYRRVATRLHFKASRREPVLLLVGEIGERRG